MGKRKVESSSDSSSSDSDDSNYSDSENLTVKVKEDDAIAMTTIEPTGYILFAKEQRAKIIEKNPKLKDNDIEVAKMIGKLWMKK